MISILKKIVGKNCGNSSYLWSQRNIDTILWWPRQQIWEMGNTNEHISTNSHQYKYIKGCMRQWYLYETKILRKIL